MAVKSEFLTEKKLNSNYVVGQLIEDAKCGKRKYFSRNEQITMLKALIKAAENKLSLCIEGKLIYIAADVRV